MIMFVGIILGKPSRDFTCPLGNSQGFKRLIAYAKCNRTFHERWIYLFVFQFYFLFCIAKGLAICKFGGVISAKCCTFKPLNSHMLILQYCFICLILYCFCVFRYLIKIQEKPLILGLKHNFRRPRNMIKLNQS